MNDRCVLEWVFNFPYISPLLEHVGIVRKCYVLALLVEHNLGGKFWDYSKRTFYPHLTHSVIVWDGVVWAWGLDLELTNQTL